MAEKKSLVEEALIQMRSLENTVAENAKGILASTMKEEIGQLVKESLLTESPMGDKTGTTQSKTVEEAEDDDTDVEDDDTDVEDDDTDVEDFGDTTTMDDQDGMTGFDFDDDTVDLTDEDISDEDLLMVFQSMGPDDGIMVKKDNNVIDLKDSKKDSHYKIQIGESDYEGDVDPLSYEIGEDDVNELIRLLDDNGNPNEDDEDFENFEEIEFNPEGNTEMGMSNMDNNVDFDMEYPDDELFGLDDEESDVVFEIEMGESMDDDLEESMDEDWTESDMSDGIEEGFKPKGTGMGKAGKFQYKNTKGGFKETMKQGTKGVGMGKAKFEYKESSKMKMEKPNVKKAETKEASRTLGAGRRFGKMGLPKPKAAPRHLNVESVNNEIQILRAKNEEYRKALNIFRDKLNEVAIFNSNLAYATRLFTEHSTTKQEKINILRRFDSVESLKESKSLYKTMKDELSSQNTTKVVKESIQEKIERTPSSGSAVNLIESKTYENPQFMRMKDLMSKMNIIK